MVKFALRLLGSLGPTSIYQRTCREAEAHGFDECWFSHDIFMSNSWVRSVAVAAVTERIGIGYMAVPFTLDPSEIATFAATLDEFSGGRAIIGTGAHTQVMYDWIGLGNRDVVELTRESVELVRRLLRGERAKYDGKYFHWTEEAYLRFPPPARRIPIYVMCFGKELCELSGEIGDGSMPMATPPEAFDIPVSQIISGARRAGRDPSEVDRVAFAWVYYAPDGDVDEAALRRVVSYFVPYLDPEMLSRIGITRKDVEPVAERLAAGDYEGAARAVTDRMLDLVIRGREDDVIAGIEKLIDRGATNISIGGPLGRDFAEAARGIGERVLPYFRGR
ncbi:LLM class flavin-dependent oxidoreductase [Conexivisphaera calida]|uniref:F420-dependent N(5),N(10)-methylenetetrahydromethanopterin reductase n=1 Tax=Conexivisphaera calida TaxID=1874277 RepID=A0A4P2VMA8_9ARCH|nr:LLM class flavin-dependent oxidoreductase [Conexivisphaera calida]BBE42178.1 F420-dependent N(5),N(10)-methylenetetrahydromethanopterin reductase [Conexivisphaera calida]